MKNIRRQQTLARPVALTGFGMWSGKDVCVRLHPAPPGTGIEFIRDDLRPSRTIRADVRHRVEMPRRTTLADSGCRVEMVEHILATMLGMRIDNCHVLVDGEEMPGFDGSAAPIVEAVCEAGLVEQETARPTLLVGETIRVGDDEAWVEARPIENAGALKIQYRLDYGKGSSVGQGKVEWSLTPDVFRKELAPARTFVLKEEADWLRDQGLGLRVSYRDILVFGKKGPIDNTLRYPDECVRHKALDMVGDLALAGCDIVGRIVAYRTGHRLNAELVRALLRECEIVDGYRRCA